MAGSLKMVDVNRLPPGSFKGSNETIRSRSGGTYRCSYAAQIETSLAHHYRTLRLQPGASEDDVKKSFRKLALQVSSLSTPNRYFVFIYLFICFLQDGKII